MECEVHSRWQALRKTNIKYSVQRLWDTFSKQMSSTSQTLTADSKSITTLKLTFIGLYHTPGK